MVSLSLTLHFLLELLLSHLFLSSSHFNQRLRIRHTRNFKNEEILLRYDPLLVCPGVHQNEGSNGGHSCEQDLQKQGKSQEGLSVVGSGALALDRRLAAQFLLSPEMSLRKLINLQQLRINDNNFNGRIPDFIQNWKGLRRLKIQGSGLKGPIPSSISVLKKKLEQLRISHLSGSNHAFPELANLTPLTQM
ncbi:hypothetical protein EZV62_006520 [Acer yangbiense]|uniref:Uncharacterized protein n=1 Tax=Acer yangbiense TaxID=1000413 RepID=A0A5C7I7U0_9ROSI|nr:hypothetical protein EZV62_006520 [Acer yangbiense]